MLPLKRLSLSCLFLGAVLSAAMPWAQAHGHDRSASEPQADRGHHWPEDDEDEWPGQEPLHERDFPPPPAPMPTPSERFGPNPHWPPGPAYRGHDQAREAVRRGEALPLREVLRRLRPEYPGRVLRVQFEYDERFGVWVYDLRMLFNENRLLRLKVDALTAEVLAVRGPRRSSKGGH